MKSMNLKTQGDVWDHYVKNAFPKKQNENEALKYPGDEWAQQSFWDKVYTDVMIPELGTDASYFVELGSGAGKQSIRTLKHFNVKELHSFDISDEFLKVYEERFSNKIGSEVFVHKLTGQHDYILEIIKNRGLMGKVDGFYSFDAMVHVDLQHLVSYFMVAAFVLKPEGKLIMDVANGKSTKGFEKMIRDIKNYYRFFGAACTKFQFLSDELISSVLNNIGFEVKFFNSDPRQHCFFIAKLVDRNKAIELNKTFDIYKL